ncbi:MAG: YbgC/FadM family acyl-CoA thioesterase [Myxococcales bacterium]|nr:YbgC/FadM family acyl-CoA thioesterase [Myxococcales bacterium]
MNNTGPFHSHTVRVYYEDTDLSGAIYHANYLRYFERAREHLIGQDRLVALLAEGVAFVVYRCELTFRAPATLGDELEIRTTPSRASDYRAVFAQHVHRQGEKLPIVKGVVEMVAVDREGKPVTLPEIPGL